MTKSLEEVNLILGKLGLTLEDIATHIRKEEEKRERMRGYLRGNN